MVNRTYIDIVLKKMCKMVGADFKKVDPKKPNWFYEYSWTEEQQEKFKNWMVNYIYTNTKARNSIMERPIKNKRIIDGLVRMFIFNYGWKLK